MMFLAKAVSFLLSPPFVLLPIPFILVGKFTQDYFYALKWTAFSYLFILAVILFIGIGVLFGVFSNFAVSKREERPLVFLFSAFVLFCYLLSLFILEGPKILFLAFFALLFGLTAVMIANKWIKASIHLAVFTAVSLLIGIIYKGYYFLFLLFIPLLAWSRVKIKEHTTLETVIGIVLGLILTLAVYIVGKQFFLEMIYN